MPSDRETRELVEAACELLPMLEDDLGAWCYLCDSLLYICDCPAARFRLAVAPFEPVPSAPSIPGDDQ